MSSTKNYAHFSPRDYLKEYYSDISDEYEDIFLSSFYHDAYSGVMDGSAVVEIGGGPTIYQLISASRKASSITFSDYKEENLAEVKKWAENSPDAFNWDDYFRLVLAVEGTAISPESLSSIKGRLRSRIKSIVPCNIFNENPFAPLSLGQFDVVSTSFCPESITDSEESFAGAMLNLFSQLKAGGTLIMTLIRNAKYYTVNGTKFSCFPIDELGIELFLKKHGFSEISVRSIPVSYDDGYDGLMGVTAVKR